MEQMQPQYIQGYVRHKRVEVEPTTKRQDGGYVIVGGLLASTGVMFAFLFIKITLAVLMIATLAYYTHSYLEKREARKTQPTLTVNELGKKKTIYI